MATQPVDLMDETRDAKETAGSEFYSTDDESTGQKCCSHKEKCIHVDLYMDKILSKTKSDSMFELRKLSHQQRPVSEFESKDTLLQFFTNRAAAAQPKPAQRQDGGAENEEVVTVDISARVQQLEPRAEGATPPQEFRPEVIQQDMQVLHELRVVNGVLQGPAQEQIDRALRDGMERDESRRRPRPRPRPRPARAEREEDDEGGDEMNQHSSQPVGRLLVQGGRSRRQRGRRVRFRPQIPTPNADGRYPVPARDQSMIVERLRQSPALNSLGDEARDEIVAEVGSLVSQQLVTSALSGEFRGVLELHIQSRAESIHHGHAGPPLQQRVPHAQQQDLQYSDDEVEERRSRAPPPAVRELREEMVMMKAQLSELKQMMRVSFDLQLDIQRSIRQEVAAALSAFLSQPPPAASASGGAQPIPASCPIPTLAPPNQSGPSYAVRGNGTKVHVMESGNCVICSEGVIDSVIYHCGHMCTCTACGLELKSKALKCPICRAPITDVIRAYTSML